jgi:hypothetical protein
MPETKSPLCFGRAGFLRATRAFPGLKSETRGTPCRGEFASPRIWLADLLTGWLAHLLISRHFSQATGDAFGCAGMGLSACGGGHCGKASGIVQEVRQRGE